MPGTIMDKPCARCEGAEAVVVVRTEHLCRECFMKYVATKAVKRLEVNKLRGAYNDAPKTILLPLSLGVSSICLLHILDQQLNAQRERSNRVGYKLHVLFVDQAEVTGQPTDSEGLTQVRQRYPSHIYSIIPLKDIFVLNVDLNDGAFGLQLTLNGKMSFDNQDRLNSMLSSLPSTTSRVDIVAVLRSRLITAFAKRNGCDSIVYGDSTTRLAERTLSETAKGRGGSLPWLTTDGIVDKGLSISYPLRDLLRKELVSYTELTSPPLTPNIAPSSSNPLPVSSKDTTIDSLMSQYFESVEQNYPSIVANVVRTSGRLAPPARSSAAHSCLVCGLPNVNSPELWSGDQGAPVKETGVEALRSGDGQTVCYGCARSTNNVTGIFSST